MQATSETGGAGPFGHKLQFAAWLGIGTLLLLLAALPVDTLDQALVGWSILLLLLVLRRRGGKGMLRVALLLLAAFLSLRYLFWRTGYTLSYHDLPSFLGALLLYAAELYGITIYLLGLFVNAHPLHRESVPLPENPALLPTVDILIPSYNETPELLEVTLMAAHQIRYPRDKLRIYLLDDGGTVQRRTDPDPQKAAEAWQRYQTLNRLCERLGIRYITRERNEHAKAGNLNAALPETRGELVLILDADHVPTVDILERTVGLFVRDEKLFLVQTPHFFINPDPVERNLRVFGQMPGENEMFYSVIQPGLDQWNASFFCGSAAVLRRRYLMQAGGLAGETITEDAETALDLHRMGYNSAYINRPMISGLQPETFASFILQRVRWAQGMTQIFMLKNPLFGRGLRLWQRLGYLSSSFFWFFGFARIVFVVAPTAYLVFGLQIYDATFGQFLAYTGPHLAAALITSNYLFGKVRWAFISELYELLQSIFSLPAIVQTMRHPHAPSFKVTPKGETLDEDYASSLAGPFYALYLVVLISLIWGIFRFIQFPEDRDITLITLGWELVNFVVLNAAIGALWERRQRRSRPRMPADMTGRLFFAGHEPVEARIHDLSVGGALLILRQKDFAPVADIKAAELLAYNAALGRWFRPRVKLRHSKPLSRGRVGLGIQYVNLSQAEVADAVAFAHGDSGRWLRFQESRNIQMGIVEGFTTLLRLGTRYSLFHFRSILFEAGQFSAGALLGLLKAILKRIGNTFRYILRRLAGALGFQGETP